MQKQDIELERMIREILHRIGMPSHRKGTDYFTMALIMTVTDSEYLRGITKILYPELARENCVSVPTVERAMRSVLETAWSMGDSNFHRELFGTACKEGTKRPSNLEFLHRMTEYVRLNGREIVLTA